MKTEKPLKIINRKKLSDINASLIAELLFTFFPFVITIFVLANQDGMSAFFSAPAWSLSAAVLTAKAIVKFLSGLLPNKKELNTGPVILIIVILMLFLFAPALFIHYLILTTIHPSIWLIRIQMLFFILSVAGFLYFGQLSQIMLFEPRQEKKT